MLKANRFWGASARAAQGLCRSRDRPANKVSFFCRATRVSPPCQSAQRHTLLYSQLSVSGARRQSTSDAQQRLAARLSAHSARLTGPARSHGRTQGGSALPLSRVAALCQAACAASPPALPAFAGPHQVLPAGLRSVEGAPRIGHDSSLWCCSAADLHACDAACPPLPLTLCLWGAVAAREAAGQQHDESPHECAPARRRAT